MKIFPFKTSIPKDHVCDICGQGGFLESLQPEFKTKEVLKVCGCCSGDLNKRLEQVRNAKNRIGVRLMKKYITQQYLEKRFKK